MASFGVNINSERPLVPVDGEPSNPTFAVTQSLVSLMVHSPDNAEPCE